MVQPVLEGEKWHRLDSNLRVCYRMAAPSSSPELEASKRFLHFFKSSSIQCIKQRIEVSQFSMACEMSVQIGEGLIWASCVAVISGSSV